MLTRHGVLAAHRSFAQAFLLLRRTEYMTSDIGVSLLQEGPRCKLVTHAALIVAIVCPGNCHLHSVVICAVPAAQFGMTNDQGSW